jgi:hypothetical protein
MSAAPQRKSGRAVFRHLLPIGFSTVGSPHTIASFFKITFVFRLLVFPAFSP